MIKKSAMTPTGLSTQPQRETYDGFNVTRKKSNLTMKSFFQASLLETTVLDFFGIERRPSFLFKASYSVSVSLFCRFFSCVVVLLCH